MTYGQFLAELAAFALCFLCIGVLIGIALCWWVLLA